MVLLQSACYFHHVIITIFPYASVGPFCGGLGKARSLRNGNLESTTFIGAIPTNIMTVFTQQDNEAEFIPYRKTQLEKHWYPAATKSFHARMWSLYFLTYIHNTESTLS